MTKYTAEQVTQRANLMRTAGFLDIAYMLNAFAALLRERERAQPVAGCLDANGKLCDPFMVSDVIDEAIWSEPNIVPLYAHPKRESAPVVPMQPTYYVAHPDGSFSLADPQPLLANAPEPPAQPAVNDVLDELTKAVAKFPNWPTDPLHAVAVLNEECGELNKAVLQQVYEPHKNEPGAVRKEALQTAAMALRFLRSLDVYKFGACEQHKQPKVGA